VNEIIALDIGCGLNPYNVYYARQLYGIDIIKDNTIEEFKIRDWLNKPMDMNLAGYSYCDLATDRIPFSDNYFDRISAVDVLEHIPRVI
jgi:cyclopropane fatty-acyl-phospholipid synthase-like methyltransferase